MGLYINMDGMSSTGKTKFINDNVEDARFQPPPHSEEAFDRIIADEYIPVCVVGNPTFDAAGLAYSWSEVQAFSRPDDPRLRVWLVVPINWALEHSPHLAEMLP
ncbi:hypothetical protein LCGC14_2607290 [marine sediment metagenome]|uniref:Uncharacterized protein n=1 Tax=marine sediment metagenome TaxID=412755 RepID=A0A0F9A6X2_9ZZZZ